jgi:hypothetical protein
MKCSTCEAWSRWAANFETVTGVRRTPPKISCPEESSGEQEVVELQAELSQTKQLRKDLEESLQEAQAARERLNMEKRLEAEAAHSYQQTQAAQHQHQLQTLRDNWAAAEKRALELERSTRRAEGEATASKKIELELREKLRDASRQRDDCRQRMLRLAAISQRQAHAIVGRQHTQPLANDTPRLFQSWA